LAVELIDFDKHLTPTMNFGFGNFIVCSSADIARDIAFNKNKSLCCKCVTFDGDVYEPGTVTGGSDNNVQYILPKWSNLKVIDDKIRVLRKDFEERNR
jgi:chromosome segregation ATPase